MFYSFAVLNLVTIAVSFWFMVRVAELDDPLVHAAALQKFEYSIAALGLLVVGSILRGLRVGRQSPCQRPRAGDARVATGHCRWAPAVG